MIDISQLLVVVAIIHSMRVYWSHGKQTPTGRASGIRGWRDEMATTQQKIDLRTARTAAAEAGLDCQIESSGDDYTITLDTGEIETVTGLPGALRVISAYTSQMSTSIIDAIESCRERSALAWEQAIDTAQTLKAQGEFRHRATACDDLYLECIDEVQRGSSDGFETARARLKDVLQLEIAGGDGSHAREALRKLASA
jgi:hypothetical protein